MPDQIHSCEDSTVQPYRKQETIFLGRRRLLGVLGFAGVGLASGFGLETTPPRARAGEEHKQRPKFDVSPPPDDVNDLSMEVAALRTMYLLKASPDQALELPDRNQFNAISYIAKSPKPTAVPPRERKEAKVSKNYRKVLTDLRAAFIANHEARIRELSDQLEELTNDEQPELDDAIEVTELARNNTHRLLLYFDANRTVPYLAAYGKEFPDPFMLILSSIGAAAKSKKPSDEDWPELRDFLIKEVSWQVGGLNLKKQQLIGAQVADYLDMTYKLGDAELKKGGMPGGKLKGPLGKIINVVDCCNIIRNVLEQDLAELLSNPRLLEARKARKAYLGAIGNWTGKGDTQVWSPR
jgi:hypothetical protein